MEETKVSVIVPVYNAEKYLSISLDSIVDQELEDIEIICVDDGSTDSSYQILKEYERKDKRIRVLSQKEPSDGAALARNLGMDHAKGEYLSFLDSDDLFEKDMLLKAYQTAKSTDADVVFFDAYVFDSENRMDYYTDKIIYYKNIPSENTFNPKAYSNKLFQMYCGSPWNNLFKRDFIMMNGIRFAPVHIADDIGFVNLAFACANRVTYLNERLVHYRRDATGNQTSYYNKWPKVGYQPFCILKTEMEKRHIFEVFKTSFVNSFLSHAAFYLMHMKSRDSFDSLYNDLKYEYMEKLSTFDVEDRFISPHLLSFRNRVRRFSPDEYLFDSTRAGGFYDKKCLLIPYAIEKKKTLRIVLYGAGVFGRAIFCTLLDEQKVKVVLWVDRDYEKMISGNVSSPDRIMNVEYDYVFVAIIDHAIYESVRSYLVKLGVEDSRIIWMEGK